MKITTLLALSLAAFNEAKPLERRADANEAATIGYATLNGGTTGGAGGKLTTVTSLSALKDCVKQSGPAICVVSGTISGNEVLPVTSDTTIIGKDYKAVLRGVGLKINGKKNGDKVRNVIVRNLTIDKVLASTKGDAIGIQYAENIWVDHCDVQGDRQADKDTYDGLVDITHGTDFVTVSNTFLHNHWKASLVGHSDSNGGEDTGHLTVTYANNFFLDLNSRVPSIRFGTAHLLNNYYENVGDGINARKGAHVLAEGNVFASTKKPLYSVDGEGVAEATDNEFGGAGNQCSSGRVSAPYSYNGISSSQVKNAVVGTAGATLKF
ncbi:hypothetical protein DL768_001528 [Monosporascus sp. mg162]|nr:hypothetical protein DL768_001528 [Monosporascus sp. mg162]